MAEQEPDYYYPWQLTVSYRDGSTGHYEFQTDEVLRLYLNTTVSWDAVSYITIHHEPMVSGKQYKVDVRHQS